MITQDNEAATTSENLKAASLNKIIILEETSNKMHGIGEFWELALDVSKVTKYLILKNQMTIFNSEISFWMNLIIPAKE